MELRFTILFQLGNCVEIGLPMMLLVIGVSQIYSLILTASGAYRHKSIATQLSCRTDRANLILTAPW
ncbi:hypothetical protein V6N13_064713 [Hibiscus sabdariffa]